MLRAHTAIRDVYFEVQFGSAIGPGAAVQANAVGPNTFLSAAMVSELAATQRLVSHAVNARLDDLRAAAADRALRRDRGGSGGYRHRPEGLGVVRGASSGAGAAYAGHSAHADGADGRGLAST